MPRERIETKKTREVLRLRHGRGASVREIVSSCSLSTWGDDLRVGRDQPNDGLNASSYAYRADGMRVAKTVGAVTTRYRYDGQMGMEDSDSTGKVIQYGLGARGIDYMQNPAPSGGYTAFPVYDPHGNMVATLSRNGLGWVVGNQRSFDCWGNVRLGAGTGDPSGRYCANLGHKQDDESGLIYMRARYYEPGSGRFISEDPGTNGDNWFSYCRNSPAQHVDRDGRLTLPETVITTQIENEEQESDGGVASVMYQRVTQAVIKGDSMPSWLTNNIFKKLGGWCTDKAALRDAVGKAIEEFKKGMGLRGADNIGITSNGCFIVFNGNIVGCVSDIMLLILLE